MNTPVTPVNSDFCYKITHILWLIFSADDDEDCGCARTRSGRIGGELDIFVPPATQDIDFETSCLTVNARQMTPS